MINTVIKENNKNINLIRNDINKLRQDIFSLKNNNNNDLFRKKTFNDETQNHLMKVNENNFFAIDNRYENNIKFNFIEEEKIMYSINGNEYNIEALFLTQNGRIMFRNGLLHDIIHKYSEIAQVVSKIQNILVTGVKFILVNKALELGDKSQTFHQKCDNLNRSLVLIETDKDVRFGGFTTKTWKGDCVKKFDNNAFVFSLDNNIIFDVINNEPAIGCYPKFEPVFFGCQIRIYDDFFTLGGTSCHRGLNYKTNIDYELNKGEQKFFVKNFEVYNIKPV